MDSPPFTRTEVRTAGSTPMPHDLHQAVTQLHQFTVLMSRTPTAPTSSQFAFHESSDESISFFNGEQAEHRHGNHLPALPLEFARRRLHRGGSELAIPYTRTLGGVQDTRRIQARDASLEEHRASFRPFMAQHAHGLLSPPLLSSPPRRRRRRFSSALQPGLGVREFGLPKEGFLRGGTSVRGGSWGGGYGGVDGLWVGTERQRGAAGRGWWRTSVGRWRRQGHHGESPDGTGLARRRRILRRDPSEENDMGART